jgi:hypothetical protein
MNRIASFVAALSLAAAGTTAFAAGPTVMTDAQMDNVSGGGLVDVIIANNLNNLSVDINATVTALVNANVLVNAPVNVNVNVLTGLTRCKRAACCSTLRKTPRREPGLLALHHLNMEWARRLLARTLVAEHIRRLGPNSTPRVKECCNDALPPPFCCSWPCGCRIDSSRRAPWKVPAGADDRRADG